LFLPLFDGLADPAVVASLSAEAEAVGWHGVFVWDHVRWREPVVEVADPWITLAAIATATERLRLGTMVTPLARRRPVKVARETATLDRLSRGRLTLGVGLGSDQFGSELSKTGEQLDDRKPGRFKSPGCRYGSRGSTETASRCDGPPGTTASSRSISNTRTRSPRSSPTSRPSAGWLARIWQRLTTSL
jgi:hypothetical protein